MKHQLIACISLLIGQETVAQQFLTLPWADPDVRMSAGTQYDGSWGPHRGYGEFPFDYYLGQYSNANQWLSFSVRAPASGLVIRDKEGTGNKGYGNILLLKHDQTDASGNHFISLFAHLESNEAYLRYPEAYRKSNDPFTSGIRVKRGDHLANALNTGYDSCESEPPEQECIHLHWEVFRGRYGAGLGVDPYDITRDSSARKKRSEYPPENGGTCGANHLFTECPPVPSAPVGLDDVILNGSFTEGDAEWDVVGDAWAGTNLQLFRTSPGYAAVGVDASGSPKDGAVGSISQSFTIPADADSALLRFWLQVESEEPDVQPEPRRDIFSVSITDLSNSMTWWDETFDNGDRSEEYVSHGFRVEHVAGHPARLWFEGTSDGANPTTFRIDNVSIYYAPTPSMDRVTIQQRNELGDWQLIGSADCSSNEFTGTVALGREIRIWMDGENLEFWPDLIPWVHDCDQRIVTHPPTPEGPFGLATCIPSFTEGIKNGVVNESEGGTTRCEFRMEVID